jgi:hypothetical protein
MSVPLPSLCRCAIPLSHPRCCCVDVTVACAPFLESGQWIRLGGRRRLRLHCAADPLEHNSTDTFPAARSGKKCQFCSKKDLNSSELQKLSYTPRRSISQFIWIWPSPTLLGLHAALLSGRQRYCLIELSLRQNFANWFSVGVVLRGWVRSASRNTAEDISWRVQRTWCRGRGRVELSHDNRRILCPCSAGSIPVPKRRTIF